MVAVSQGADSWLTRLLVCQGLVWEMFDIRWWWSGPTHYLLIDAFFLFSLSSLVNTGLVEDIAITISSFKVLIFHFPNYLIILHPQVTTELLIGVLFHLHWLSILSFLVQLWKYICLLLSVLVISNWYWHQVYRFCSHCRRAFIISGPTSY